MKKKLLITLFVVVFAVMFIVSANAINVTVDGKEVVFKDAVPFIDENSRTLTPLRAIGESMGLAVEWDETQQKASFIKTYTKETTPKKAEDPSTGDYAYVSGETMNFYIDSAVAEFETFWTNKDNTPNENKYTKKEIKMDTSAIIKDSRTYAPARYLAQAFLYQVSWEGDTETVVIESFKYLTEKEIKNAEHRDYIANAISFVPVKMSNNLFAFAFCKNGDYSKIKSVEIKKAGVNGDVVENTTPLTEKQISSVEEVYESEVVASFAIEQNFVFSNTYSFNVIAKVTMSDGSIIEYTVTTSAVFDAEAGCW